MNKLFAAAVILSVTLFASISCLSPAVTNKTLFAPLQLAWPAVEVDFDRGVLDGLDDGALDSDGASELFESAVVLSDALHREDPLLLRKVGWPELSPWVTRGINDALEDGEIGKGVASSLREQLVLFTSGIEALQEN